MRLPFVLFEQMADSIEKYEQKVKREQQRLEQQMRRRGRA